MDLTVDGSRGRCSRPPEPGRLETAAPATRGRALAAERRSAAGQSLPPLPKLPLDTYEPASASRSRRPYEAVQRAPRDPERNGTLGMLLYANEQYELAETCFERAHALAPAEARWPYYLGRTQSNLARHDRRRRVARRRRCGASRRTSPPGCCWPRASWTPATPTRAGRSTRRSWASIPTPPRPTTAWAGSTAARGEHASAVEHLARPASSSRLRRRSLRARAGVPRPRREGEGPGGARPLPEGQARLAGRPRSLHGRSRRSQDRRGRPPAEGHPARARPGSCRRRPTSTRRRSPPTRRSCRRTST